MLSQYRKSPISCLFAVSFCGIELGNCPEKSKCENHSFKIVDFWAGSCISLSLPVLDFRIFWTGNVVHKRHHHIDGHSSCSDVNSFMLKMNISWPTIMYPECIFAAKRAEGAYVVSHSELYFLSVFVQMCYWVVPAQTSVFPVCILSRASKYLAPIPMLISNTSPFCSFDCRLSMSFHITG